MNVTRTTHIHQPITRRGLGILVLGIAALPMVRARADLTVERPEKVGMSAERLGRIEPVVRRAIDERQVTGAVALVARKGKVVHFQPYGVMDLETRAPMRRDTVFRMASSTKPVTAVAVMILVEEGKVRLSDPVSRFLPEFKRMQVAEAGPNEGEFRNVPAKREMTVLDLLTHTSGLAGNRPGPSEAQKIIAAKRPEETLAQFIPRFAGAPLDFQPGSLWRYSGLIGFDVLARIVEVASGSTLNRFLEERIFVPLGMRNTFFVVPEARRNQQATLYRKHSKGLERIDPPAVLAGSVYFSGAGGLLSTAEDFFCFAQMLANGGELNGKRILSPRTVDLLTSNHVGEMFVGQLGRPAGMGFGLGGEVVLDPIRAGTRRSAGSYGWDGAYGTHFWVDRKEGLVGVLMIQTGGNKQLHRDFENAVMQAVIE